MRQLTRRQKIGWGIMAFLSTGVTIFVLGQYGGANPDNFFDRQQATYVANLAGIMTHIYGGAIALLIGPFLFLPAMRQKKRLNWHRWIGRFYMLGVLASGLAGFYMASLAYGGLPAKLGLTGLAIAWLTTVYMAYTRVRQKNIKAHERWMIRNYAVTFSAVTFRLVLALGAILLPTTDFVEVYITATWLGWVPNLLFAEWLINYRQRKRSQRQPAVELAAAD